jgi:hypothetical protein
LDLADYLIRFDYKEFQNKPVTAPQTDLLNIHSNDVLEEGLTQSLLTEEFNHVTILHLMMKNGKYDLLYDNEAQLLQPGNEQLVKQIEDYFEKKFFPVLRRGGVFYSFV